MNGTSSQAPAASRLELMPTQVGFELLADPNDWVSKLLLRDGIYDLLTSVALDTKEQGRVHVTPWPSPFQLRPGQVL